MRADRAEQPEWPVQDEGGHWHYAQFNGQLVCYRSQRLHFGIEVREIDESAIARNDEGDLDLNGLYLCDNGKIFAEL